MIHVFFPLALIISIALYLNKNKIINYSLVILYALLIWIFTFYQFYHKGETHFQFFTADAIGLLLLGTLSIVMIPALFHAYRYIKTHFTEPRIRGIFFGSVTLLLTSISMAYLANHIAVTWIFVEITTLSASLLVYHHRNQTALEGTWKYVFVCAISITFIFIGILFLSLSLKNAGTNDLSFEALYRHASRLDTFWLKMAFLFIFTGFTAKIGLFPMYTAGIDAKDKAPAPVGALLSSVLMNLGFVGIYRFYAVVARTDIAEWASKIMLISAVISIFIAAVYMTRIKNIKRMFAYSSIEHMGLVILGLAAGGIGIYAAILHLVLHTFIKPGLFFQFNQVYRIYQSKSIYDTGSYFKYNKTGAMVLLLGFISATAMPPSGLFVSELYIFQSLFESHRFILLGFVALLLTLIIWGFGSNIFRLLFTPPLILNESRLPKIKPWESLSQFILLALAVYAAYMPPKAFVQLLHDSVNLLTN